MDKIYYHLLKTYIKESQKLVEERVSKNDMIILDDSMQKFKQSQSVVTDQAYQSSQGAGGGGRFNTENLVGVNALNQSQLSGRSYGATSSYIPTSVFDIEERLQIIERIDSSPLVSHISQQKQKKYVIEEIFRS